jgi:hypothetical protein
MESRINKAKSLKWEQTTSCTSCIRKQYIEGEKQVYKKLYEELLVKNKFMEKQNDFLAKENEHLRRYPF